MFYLETRGYNRILCVLLALARVAFNRMIRNDFKGVNF